MFTTGSIISLELKNFMTYNYVKFDFHPKLNFIAGPNGSGKSSISNAIAFVFGGSQKTIGKGKEKQISDFVKFGELDGFVQIVLKDVSRNLIIKRCINSNLKTTLWFLNNQNVKFPEIQKIYQRLKIDVSNLCNFLPQEKVIEFCKATPEQLFDNLIEMLNLETERNSLDFLEQQKIEKIKLKESLMHKEQKTTNSVNLLKIDVEKINEKTKLENKLNLMKIRKNWIIYDSLEKEYKLSCEDLKIFQKDFKEKETQIKNVNEKIIEIENKKQNEKHVQLINEFQQENVNIEDFYFKSSKLLNEKYKIEKEIEIQNKKEEQSRLQISTLLNHIDILKQRISEFKLSEMPIKGDFEEKIQVLEAQIEGKVIALQEIKNESINLAHEVQKSERIKQLIQSEDSRRLELLKEYHKDTYTAVLWLRKNQNLFQKPIIEPAFINLKIKNMNYAPEIETFLNFQTLSSFICQTTEDYNNFLNFCKDKNNLGINATQKFSKMHKSPESIKNLGFDGYIIDFLDGPEEVLEMLCGISNLHLIPISKKEIEPESVFKAYGLTKIVTNNSFIEIKRSKYNKSDSALIKTPTLMKSKIFVNNLPDPEIIEKKILNLKTIQKKNNIKYEEILKEKENLNFEINEYFQQRIIYKHEVQKILIEKERKENFINEIKTKEIEISELKNFKKKDFKTEMFEIQNELNLFKKEIITFLEKKSKFKSFFKDLITIEKSFLDLNIQLRHLKLQTINFQNEIENLNLKIKNTTIKKETQKINILNLKKDLINEFSTEDKIIMDSFPDLLTELDQLINLTASKLLFLNVNTASLNEFKNKESQLNEILINKNELNTNILSINKRINEIETNFCKKISEAISSVNSNFSKFFRTLKMDGKIEIEKLERVCKWKLNIFVKFRQNEDFQLLRSSFQSGGEKSVSTILFLLALIQISPSPFRLVDEINQGMDKFNEKGVHNILVKLQSNTQFFIITPKIVDELDYSKDMKVFIIFPNTCKVVSEIFSNYKDKLISN